MTQGNEYRMPIKTQERLLELKSIKDPYTAILAAIDTGENKDYPLREYYRPTEYSKETGEPTKYNWIPEGTLPLEIHVSSRNGYAREDESVKVDKQKRIELSDVVIKTLVDADIKNNPISTQSTKGNYVLAYVLDLQHHEDRGQYWTREERYIRIYQIMKTLTPKGITTRASETEMNKIDLKPASKWRPYYGHY